MSKDSIFPESLMIRDTGLNDDLGGSGRRIYTTAGSGYDRVEYFRDDVVERLRQELERITNDPLTAQINQAQRDLMAKGTEIRTLRQENKALRADAERLSVLVIKWVERNHHDWDEACDLASKIEAIDAAREGDE